MADLTRPNCIPTAAFDCIICTYSLHLIFAAQEAVVDLARILKPGGVLFIAVPYIARGYYQEWVQYYSFTREGLQDLLTQAFGTERLLVRTYGNSLTAAGTLRGLAASDFTATELGSHDPDFAIAVFARVQKHIC